MVFVRNDMCSISLLFNAVYFGWFYSQTGKRLMAKCRMLLTENEELGKVISSGRMAKLEGEIALEKTLVQEMKKSQEGEQCPLLTALRVKGRDLWSVSQWSVTCPSPLNQLYSTMNKYNMRHGIFLYYIFHNNNNNVDCSHGPYIDSSWFDF